MTSIGRDAFRHKYYFNGELTNENVKDELEKKMILPTEDFDYLAMLDAVESYDDFDNYVMEAIDIAIAEETFGSERQCDSFLKFINSETTLAEYKKSFYFSTAVSDMTVILRSAGHHIDPRTLFSVQPGYAESKFETTVGYNDNRFRHMFLGNIASSLPSYDGF